MYCINVCFYTYKYIYWEINKSVGSVCMFRYWELVIFLKQGNMLKLHVKTKGRLWNLEWRRCLKQWEADLVSTQIFFFSFLFSFSWEDCNIGEMKHCQSMKGSFPWDLISAYLHLLASCSHGGTDAEVQGDAGTKDASRTIKTHRWTFGQISKLVGCLCILAFCQFCQCRPPSYENIFVFILISWLFCVLIFILSCFVPGI